MILGTGADIVENARIEAVISRHGKRFVKRIFSKREAARLKKFRYARQTVAANFAAKEAIAKALGTGFRFGVSFSDIEVVHDRRGKPHINLSGTAADFAKKMGAKRIHLSLSHEKSHSVAVVILES